jgi:uncharacterized protein YlbG (UPF0298 family)
MECGKIYECDEELKKQSNGDKYFVLYAEETKMKTFSNKKDANKFISKLKDGKGKVKA